MGKSTTAAMIDRRKIPVFDADKVVHNLLSKGGPTLELVQKHFPSAVADDRVDRAILGKIVFNDPRRFGSIHLVLDPKNHFLLKHLGPEPLSKDFNGDYLFNKIKKSKSPIKTALMNQKNVVGIGNIYVNEILFNSKIRPTRKCKTLTKKDNQEIAISTKKILKSAIKAGGTTLQDFYKPDGNKGYFKIDLSVYDRDGDLCLLCKKEFITKITQSQRSTFFCKNCQI